MKIAIGIYHLSPRGGLEDHAIRIAGELSGRGHEVVLYTTGDVPDVALPVVSLERRRWPTTNHGRMAAFAAHFREATRGKYHRIVGFQPIPGTDVLFLADHLRNRADAPALKRLLPRFRTYARLEAACFGPGSATRIMGLAHPQMEAFVRRYPESRSRIVILPPTIKESRRAPHLRTPELRATTRKRLGIDGDAKTWLWLGLQPHIKGLDRVVDALASVKEATLLVGGISPKAPKLAPIIRSADRLGISHRIRWLGYLSGNDLLGVFGAADVLSHPARVDVTGGVILEALVNGLPVVATSECGFAVHIERSRGGMVVKAPFDGHVFARLLIEACGLQNAELSRNGIAYGESPELYSGLAVACDLIEAETWPREMTMVSDGAGNVLTPAASA